MHLTLHTAKAGVATVVSLGMAVLGCLLGCMQPAASSSDGFFDSPASWNTSADPSQPMPMADGEICHGFGGNSSLPPSDRKPVSNGPLSCCPLEVTVIQKWDTASLEIAPPQELAAALIFPFVLSRVFGSTEFAPPISHSGRDSLLATHLLRI
jgi:hypothetical protein